MKRKIKYPCPKCNSKDIEPIIDNPKYDSGNIFGFTRTDYRSLPTWKCNKCNFYWNNYDKINRSNGL